MSDQEVKAEPISSDEEFDDDEVDSESSSDADAKLAEDDVFDIEFFKCYSALKKKDDKIYDKNVKFFDEELSSEDGEADGQSEGKSLLNLAKKSSKPKMTLLDHQLKLNDTDIEEPNESASKIDLNKEVSKSYYEKELDEIKKNIEKIGEDINSDSEDELLVVKDSAGTSSSKPRRKIAAMLDELEEDQDIKHLKQIWSDPAKLSDDDKFLRDYILNKRYIATNVEENSKAGFFSSNLDDMSDAETEGEKDVTMKHEIDHRSDEKDFDKLSRIPRNSTKTIRDLVQKNEKKEKRLKKLEKKKKKKKSLKDADCEDIVGDLPTKFHYRETEPNDYGLSAQELLMATDEELDQWVALKDAIRYKTTEEEIREKKKFDQKRDDIELKKKVFKSLYGDEKPDGDVAEDEAEGGSISKSKKRNKRKRNNDDDSIETKASINDTCKKVKNDIPKETKESEASRKKKKHKKRGLNHKKFAKTGVAPDRLLAYGLSKTKLKKSKLL